MKRQRYGAEQVLVWYGAEQVLVWCQRHRTPYADACCCFVVLLLLLLLLLFRAMIA